MDILVVEDDKNRVPTILKRFHGNNITVTSSFKKARRILATEPKFDLVLLDHDLNEDEDNAFAGMYGTKYYNGQDVAWFICMGIDDSRKPSKVLIHSNNEDGAAEMQRVFEEHGIRADIEPFDSWSVQ